MSEACGRATRVRAAVGRGGWVVEREKGVENWKQSIDCNNLLM